MLVISLTAIPPRFHTLNATLKSLLKQHVKADEIILNIPRKYRRFDFSLENLPQVVDGVSIHIVDADYGPATKILPVVKKYSGRDVKILFCDDDRLYDRNWSRRFLECSQERPGECIVEAGWEISDISRFDYTGRDLPRAIQRRPPKNYFQKKLRKLTRDRRLYESSGYVEILGGCCGVLVRPDYFDVWSFDIPDTIWTVDDIWLSGCLKRKGVKIWANAHGRDAVRGDSDLTEALFDFSVDGVDRSEANAMAIEYFRTNYAIWTNE